MAYDVAHENTAWMAGTGCTAVPRWSQFRCDRCETGTVSPRDRCTPQAHSASGGVCPADQRESATIRINRGSKEGSRSTARDGHALPSVAVERDADRNSFRRNDFDRLVVAAKASQSRGLCASQAREAFAANDGQPARPWTQEDSGGNAQIARSLGREQPELEGCGCEEVQRSCSCATSLSDGRSALCTLSGYCASPSSSRRKHAQQRVEQHRVPLSRLSFKASPSNVNAPIQAAAGA